MDAILLLGPTGVGKTPLGALLEARGLLGRRCLHFDFGACLRQAASKPVEGIDDAIRTVVGQVLEEGRLLEDPEWPIAEALLAAFLAAREAREDDWLVLNGLPRHGGQAAAMERLHPVRAVCGLAASPDVILQRIRLDTGGDRAVRTDDTTNQVRLRLARYAERTRPLLDHYRGAGVPVLRVEVSVESRPDDALESLAAQLADALGEGP